MTVTTPTTVQYKDVPGFTGYRVGDDGTVWSCRSINGRGPLKDSWRQLRSVRRNETGHAAVSLCSGQGGIRPLGVHRLVLQAFVGPCPSGMQCCHWDGNPANNALSNLRWGTPKENQADRTRHGTEPWGEKNPSAKLTETRVKQIRLRYLELKGDRRKAAGYVMRDLAKEFGVNRATIIRVCNRKTWAHVD